LHDGTTSAVFGVVTFGKVANPDTNYGLIGNNANGSINVGAHISYDDRAIFSFNNSVFSTISKGSSGNRVADVREHNRISVTDQTLMTTIFNADATASLRIRTGIDGGVLFGNNTDTNAPVTTDATYNLQIGARGDDSFTLTGYIQELIFYNTDQSANREDIENNINAYYVVYGVLHYRQRVADDSGTFAIEDRDQTVYNSVTTPEMPSLICSCDAYKATKLYNINPA
jgi:hypothetical protein